MAGENGQEPKKKKKKKGSTSRVLARAAPVDSETGLPQWNRREREKKKSSVGPRRKGSLAAWAGGRRSTVVLPQYYVLCSSYVVASRYADTSLSLLKKILVFGHLHILRDRVGRWLGPWEHRKFGWRKHTRERESEKKKKRERQLEKSRKRALHLRFGRCRARRGAWTGSAGMVTKYCGTFPSHCVTGGGSRSSSMILTSTRKVLGDDLPADKTLEV